MHIKLGFSLRNLQKVSGCIAMGLSLLSVNPAAQAASSTPERQAFCFLKPQNASVDTHLRVIESSENNFYTLKTLAQVLNPSKDLKASIDSYNVFFPWKKTPSRQWISNHCHLIGDISKQDMAKKLKDPTFQFPPATLNLVSVHGFLNPGQKAKTYVPYKPSEPEELAPSLPPLQVVKNDFIIVKPAEVACKSLAFDCPKLKEVESTPWSIAMAPIVGFEFLNAGGMGITNKISVVSLGADLELQRKWGSRFSLYARGRYLSLSHTRSESPTQINLDLESDHSLSLGFDIYFLPYLKAGLAYKTAKWTLFERTAPTFALNPLDEKVKALVFNFDWQFNRSSKKGWGLKGAYGVNIPNHEGNSIQDFHTALFYRWNSLHQTYTFSIGYEVLKYDYDIIAGPSSIDEINRNRYFLSFSTLYPL